MKELELMNNIYAIILLIVYPFIWLIHLDEKQIIRKLIGKYVLFMRFEGDDNE